MENEHMEINENIVKMLPHEHNHNTPGLVSHIPEEEKFVLGADVFAQLCDPTRLKILWFLCHTEECVSDIAAVVDMSLPAVSHHLKLLKQTGLLTSRREGKEILYTLADNEKARLVHHMIDDLFGLNCCKNL